MKLTIARINSARIPPDKSELKLWDAAVNGLYLRLLPGGGRSWVYRYRADGGGRLAKIRSIKLGSYPALSIDAARTAAKAHAGQIARGIDPATVRQENRRRQQATLGSLLAVDGPYERHLRDRGIVKGKVALSNLRRGLARYMAIDISKLSRRDLVEALDALQDKPGAQAELRKCTRSLLEWAANTGLAHSNVLAGMRVAPKSRAQKLEEASRRRAFDDADITRLWHVAGRSGTFGSLVQLGLLTAMRRNELATLRWSDIQPDRIVLLAEVTKTGMSHEVPLTDLMGRILERQSRTTSPLVFPSSVNGRALQGWTKFKNRLMREADIGDWTIHDLRRTCRTLMSRCGVLPPIAELAIGHVRETLISLYNLDEQWSGRVDAFQRVSNHIEQLIGCSIPVAAQK